MDNCRFAEEQVQQLDKNKLWSRTLDGSDYLPGMVLNFVLSISSVCVWPKYYRCNKVLVLGQSTSFKSFFLLFLVFS